MRAIQMAKTGGPEVLEYVEMPKPELNAGQVLVRVHAIGVGKPDVLVRTGVYKWMPPLPTTPGVEATGHIAAVGTDVEGLRVGEPVFVYPWMVYPTVRGGGKDVFVHISAVERAGLSTLREGQQLEYEIANNRGKESAENLKVK